MRPEAERFLDVRTVRAVRDGQGAVRTSVPEFFERHPELLRHLHAAASLHEPEATEFDYLWARDTAVWRARIEVTERDGALLDLHPIDSPYGLTTRELQVLTLLAGGLTNVTIAERLGATRRTVATHVEHILAKVGQETRAGAAAVALGRDLLLAADPGTALDALPIGRLWAAVHADGTGPPGALTVPAEPLPPYRPPTPPRPARRRPIRLGSIYPLDGHGADDGRTMRRGADLAVHELNARGGIGGRPIEHVVLPTDITDPRRTLESVDRLLDSDVDAITLGYVAPHHEVQVLERAAEHGSPLLHTMVSPAGPASVAADPRRLGQTFQICAGEDAYGAGFIRTVTGLRDAGGWRPHNRRLLFVLRDTMAGEQNLLRLQRLAQASGWEVAGVLQVSNVGVGWAEVLDTVHREDPAAVLLTTYIEGELLAFLRAFSAAPSPSLLCTVWAPSVPGFLTRVGEVADGLVWSTVIGVYDDAIGAAFARRYLERYGTGPGRASAGIHYDMTHLLASAWSQVRHPWAFEEVTRVLRTMVHRGVAGGYSLSGEGQRGLAYPDDTRDASLAHAHLVYQVQGGRHRLIGPDTHDATAFRAPVRTK
ncbi:MAG: ABC transporter substrate-binding protein [Streptosporangiales bacterium]|nr:ABC transporter substrate-binding protein [Streptosporangiales bacterium]